MAKPNYQFDKRQRELKKIKQQEEKRQKKQARDGTAEPAATETPQEQAT
ncbi:MAG: hypothetical protein ACRESS_04365 [Stenotrophobium sp.]